MHAYQVLFEVVEARPQLARFGTGGSEAPVHAGFANMFTMNGFLVSVQVVDGGKSYRAPRTTFFDAAV
jgi:hypothetical protein